jgi:hypothetical protein
MERARPHRRCDHVLLLTSGQQNVHRGRGRVRAQGGAGSALSTRAILPVACEPASNWGNLTVMADLTSAIPPHA